VTGLELRCRHATDRYPSLDSGGRSPAVVKMEGPLLWGGPIVGDWTDGDGQSGGPRRVGPDAKRRVVAEAKKKNAFGERPVCGNRTEDMRGFFLGRWIGTGCPAALGFH